MLMCTACVRAQAVVDVISSSSWLNPALAAMEMAQMVTQGMWERDSVLTQIPHVTAETAARAKARNSPVETIFDLIDLEVRLLLAQASIAVAAGTRQSIVDFPAR